MIKVFLVDDHGVVRMGLRALIAMEPDMEVVGEAPDGWKALDLLGDPALAVDVVTLDLSMPRLHGMEVLERLFVARPGISVLILSMHAEEHLGRALIARGAAGYLSKDRADAELADAVRMVARGRVFMTRRIAGQPTDPRLPHETLSPREIQVFMLLVEGRQVGDIAAELNLTMSTVSTHVGKIRGKLGVQSIAEIVGYAHRHGLAG